LNRKVHCHSLVCASGWAGIRCAHLHVWTSTAWHDCSGGGGGMSLQKSTNATTLLILQPAAFNGTSCAPQQSMQSVVVNDAAGVAALNQLRRARRRDDWPGACGGGAGLSRSWRWRAGPSTEPIPVRRRAADCFQGRGMIAPGDTSGALGDRGPVLSAN
jgi:hypothetical protein